MHIYSAPDRFPRGEGPLIRPFDPSGPIRFSNIEIAEVFRP